MAKLTIDNTEYETDEFSAELKAQLTSLRFVDNELRRLHAQIAVMKTARTVYSDAIKASLKGLGSSDSGDLTIEGLGENIEF